MRHPFLFGALDDRPGYTPSAVLSMTTKKDIKVNETVPGVFVASCQTCGAVIAVKHTRAELETAKLEHICRPQSPYYSS
jgi:hypothetical protein